MKRMHLKQLGYYRSLLMLMGILIAAVLLVPQFSSTKNISSVMQQISVNGVVAIGMTMVIITGGFDLSVGSVMALSGVVCMKTLPYGIWIAIPAALMVGVMTGLLNGLVISKLKINPFITTLGFMAIVRGLVMGITNARPVSVWNADFAQISLGSLGMLPYPFLIMLALGIIAQIFVRYSKTGQAMSVYGSNREAGYLAGLPMDRTLVAAYTLCGFTAAFAGIMLASRLSTGSPVIAEDAALMAIAATVIGGTSLSGGSGSIWKTVIGVLILGVMTNIMNMLEIKSYYQTVIKGLLVVIVVLMDSPVVKKFMEGFRRK